MQQYMHIDRNSYVHTNCTLMSKHTTTVIMLRVSTDRNNGTDTIDRWHAISLAIALDQNPLVVTPPVNTDMQFKCMETR